MATPGRIQTLTITPADNYTVRAQLPAVVARTTRHEGAGMRGARLARAVSAGIVATGSFVGGAASFSPGAAGAAIHATDISGTITLDGTKVPVNFTSSGQNAQITFS